MWIKTIFRYLAPYPLYFLLLPLVLGQEALDLNLPATLDYNLPEKAEDYLGKIQANYTLSNRLNPFYLRGDFDGDSSVDYAFLVTSNRTKENGIAFYLSSKGRMFVVGAGTSFNEMTDLDFYGWLVYSKKKVSRGVGEGAPPILKGDAIVIKWEESASAIIYWNGQRFIWYQQGD